MGDVAVVMAEELSAGALTLRALTESDATDLHAIFSDPATHTIGDGAVSDLEWTHRWLQRREELRRRDGITWYGVRSVDDELIGTAGLFFGRTGDDPEFGFEIRADLQGRGYGSQVASAVVAEAHRAGIHRLWATVRPWNVASLRCVRRVGFIEDRVTADERGDLVFLRHGNGRRLIP